MTEKGESSNIKGGEFLIKDSEASSIFIPEDMNEEQKLVLESVHDFIENEIFPHTEDIEKQKEGLVASLIEKAAELGLLGAHIPEAYGGMEMDGNTNTAILEAMGTGGSFSVGFAAHTGIGMLPILYYGTEEQKQKYLPDLCNGTLKASYCLTEPGSGSDALSAKTKAILSDDGKHYILSGQKMWITNAGFADVFIVFAQIDGDKFTGFIVEKGAEGLTLGAEEEKLGIKGSSTRQVFFENVKVPVENVLGEISKGHRIAFNVLNVGRFKLAVAVMGGSKASINNAIEYANERIQFGTPISSFGAIKYKLAEQAIRTYALESTVYRLSDLLDKKAHEYMKAEGIDYADAKLKAAEEYAVECAMIKVQGSETLDYVVDETLQIHGGNGFSEEFKCARSYRDSRINRIFEGTNEINRLLSVSMLLKRAMKGKIDLVGPAWEVQKELASMPAPMSIEGPLAEEKKALKNLKKMLLMTAGAGAKYQMDGKLDLKEEQEIVMNIADIMIHVYSIESMLLRVEKLIETDREASLAQKMLEVFITDTMDKAAKAAKDALNSFAGGDELRIMLMGVKRFNKYKAVNVKEHRREVAAALIEANKYIF